MMCVLLHSKKKKKKGKKSDSSVVVFSLKPFLSRLYYKGRGNAAITVCFKFELCIFYFLGLYTPFEGGYSTSWPTLVTVTSVKPCFLLGGVNKE